MDVVNFINLEKRKDRLESFLNQAKEQGFEAKRWEGELQEKNTKEAITRSHKRIIQDAKDNNKPYCIIAEDDSVFIAPGAFDYFISQIPQSYDIFFAMYYICNKVDGNRILGEASGICTLYVVHERFYNYFLSIEPNCHIDRRLSKVSSEFEMYVPPLICCEQVTDYSDQRKAKVGSYRAYLEGRELFKGET